MRSPSQNGIEQNPCRCVKRHFGGNRGRDPSGLARLVVEFHPRFAFAAAGVIQQDEMGVAVKFLRVNAVLHEHKFDAGHVEIGFLLDFAAERGLGGFAPFDFAAGDAPEIRPFVRANHQHLARAVENQRPDSRQRRMRLFKLSRRRCEVQVVFFQHTAQFAEVLDDQIRFRRAQLFQRVVAGEHGARVDPAVPRRLDVVLHVADEKRFLRLEIVFGEDFVDFFPLVPNVRVRLVEKGIEAGDTALGSEMFFVNGAQQERAEFLGAAEFEELAGVRQFADRILGLPEAGVEPFLELRHRHMRRVAVVEIGERQGKLGAEFVERHFGAARLREDKIGRLQNGGQIVHQRARPVKDDVANHTGSLTKGKSEATESEFRPCLNLAERGLSQTAACPKAREPAPVFQ